MRDVHILSARRSALVPRGGAFRDLLPHEIAAPVVQAVLDDAGISGSEVDDIIVANSLGQGGNPARIVALAADLPLTVAGLSIDRQCAGGLDALILAANLIRSGQYDVIVAGGVESYSRRPIRLQQFSDGRPPIEYDQAPFTPWPDKDPGMAEAAEALAKDLAITQAQQDDWAIESHKKARACVAKNCPEIVTINGIDRDPFTRNLTEQHTKRAQTVHGSITAANMAVAADGAAFVVLASDRFRNAQKPDTVVFESGMTLGGNPFLPGLAPIAAIEQVLANAETSPHDLRIAEIMEAFAVQAIACENGAGIPHEIVNPGGGALARGHPIGASGAVLAVRLFHALEMRGGTGLATIAAAGGLGSAVLLSKN